MREYFVLFKPQGTLYLSKGDICTGFSTDVKRLYDYRGFNEDFNLEPDLEEYLPLFFFLKET